MRDLRETISKKFHTQLKEHSERTASLAEIFREPAYGCMSQASLVLSNARPTTCAFSDSRGSQDSYDCFRRLTSSRDTGSCQPIFNHSSLRIEQQHHHMGGKVSIDANHNADHQHISRRIPSRPHLSSICLELRQQVLRIKEFGESRGKLPPEHYFLWHVYMETCLFPTCATNHHNQGLRLFFA